MRLYLPGTKSSTRFNRIPYTNLAWWAYLPTRWAYLPTSSLQVGRYAHLGGRGWAYLPTIEQQGPTGGFKLGPLQGSGLSSETAQALTGGLRRGPTGVAQADRWVSASGWLQR